ncbi:MAG TPA: hypothetical protein VGO50_21300 [Pyrinomonadaceae bacterium]|nr:hypothetical protein [Pyrinomonadaceae bacterium]
MSKRLPGALIEFRDAATGKPVSVKMKAGVAIKGRKDAFYAVSVGDPGLWQADVKPGRYKVIITAKSGPVEEKYDLNLNAAMPACTAGNGYLNIMSCGAVGTGGSSDDTQAIIDGLNALDAIGGGTLFFPNGYFNVGTTSTTAGYLPIELPSNTILQGIAGSLTGGSYGSSRITLISPGNPTGIHNKAVFKIGEWKYGITIRDVGLLGYDTANSGGIVPGSIGVLGEGNFPNSTFKITFSEMDIAGFNVGIDVRQCKAANVLGLNCAEDPEEDPPTLLQPWQFDQVKVDHVSFTNNIGVRIDTMNSDWNFSSCWFNTPVDTGEDADHPSTIGIHLKRGGFIQMNNTFGGGTGGAPGGAFIYINSEARLQIVNSQTENINNSIIYGRDRILPGEQYADMGNTASAIVITGSQFGAPIKLRGRVAFVSTGNNYAADTIQTDNAMVRVYSMGDKFCYDGYQSAGPACTSPGVSGPGTIVFSTGAPEEGSFDGSGNPIGGAIRELPNKFGVRSVFSKEVQLGTVTYSVLSSTYSAADNGTLLYCSDCAANSGTGACQASGGGALAKRIGGAWKCN